MVTVPMVHTQLVPPRAKKCIGRTRLHRVGLSILSHRLTSVVAPAGYGKTVWVSSLVEEPSWPPTAWLALDSCDGEASFLLYHLIYALRRIIPAFGVKSLRTMNSLEDAGRDWRIAAGALVEEFPRESDIVLVLDDCHVIEPGGAAGDILAYLVRRLPAGVHLVLIGRNSLIPDLMRAHSGGLAVRSDQLVFSLEEAGELLSGLGLQLTPEEVAAIQARAQGWAVGLRLLGLLLKEAGRDLTSTSAVLQEKEAELCAYLGSELLDCLPPQLASFLLEASLLPYLEPELCNHALGLSDSEVKIEQLHSLGLLSRTGGETVTWRPHQLVGEFLVRKTVSLHTPEAAAAIRHRAAAFLAGRSDIDRALEQLAACGDWPAAAGYLRRYGDTYFLEPGRLDALNLWLGRLPEELVAGDCWLLFFQGMSLIHDQPDRALNVLSTAADTAGGRGDLKCQLRSLLAMLAIYTFSNNVRKIRQTARRIPMAAALLKSSWSRGVVLVGALGQAAWGDNLRQGALLSRLVGKLGLDPQSRMGYLVFSAIVQLRLGNLTAARDLVHELLADPYVQADERWIGRAYTIQAAVFVLTGEHEKLAQTCGGMLRLAEKYGDWRLAGIAHRHMAQLHQWRGDPDQAREEFASADRAFVRGNQVFYAYVTDLDQFRLRQQAGENTAGLLEEAGYVLERLKGLAGEPDLDDYALSVAGIIALEAGRVELARQRFEAVRQSGKRKGARQLVAGAQLFLARVAMLLGTEDVADRWLGEALGAAEAGRWEFFWDWHPESVWALCLRALARGIHPGWAARLLRRWFPERLRREAGVLLACPLENVRAAVAGLLQDVLPGQGVPVVHVNCLGGFGVFVNGGEIAPSRWKTKRAAGLFRILLIERRQHFKEEIIERLWPEADPRLGDANLRMALTHVRQALGLAENEGVLSKRGRVYLNPGTEVHTDYELFAAAAQRALAEADDNPVTADRLEQAAELYRGEFLPDNRDEDWTARGELAQLYLRLLTRLIASYRRQGKSRQALEACRRYLALEPADEPVCRAAMEILWQGGDKAGALALFRELAAALAGNYSGVPDAATRGLYEKIRGG